MLLPENDACRVTLSCPVEWVHNGDLSSQCTLTGFISAVLCVVERGYETTKFLLIDVPNGKYVTEHLRSFQEYRTLCIGLIKLL